MTYFEATSLFTILLILAATPSASVALVVTRSATLGITNGIAVSIGIVLGDLIFITLAILGLGAIAESMGDFFLIIKYLGGAYLLWIGYCLLISTQNVVNSPSNIKTTGSLISSFLSGFFLTMGDVKAIFFYISLFPTFIDVNTLQTLDIIIIGGIALFTVGGIKIAYAICAIKVMNISRNMQLEIIIKRLAGCLMICVAGYLIFKT